MKKITKIAAVASSVLLGTLTSNAHAWGEADGVWLKQKFVAKGYDVENTTGIKKIKSFTSICYTQLVWNSGFYVASSYCPDNTGTYNKTNSDLWINSVTPEFAMGEQVLTYFNNNLGNNASGYANYFIDIKLNSPITTVHSVKLKTVGGLAHGKIDPNNPSVWFTGSFTSTGSMVPASAVPF